MRKRILLLGSIAAIALTGAAAPAARATTLRLVSGPAVASGASVAAALKAGTAFVLRDPVLGSVTCSSSQFSGSVGTNPAPAVRLSLSPPSLAGCVDSVPLVAVVSVTTTFGPSPNATATFDRLLGSTLAVDRLQITIVFSTGASCSYRPALGSAAATHDSFTSPWNDEYAFSVLMSGGGPAGCPSNPIWSATYRLSSGGTGITIQS
ncbi:MAG TPA: hypothetical protein VF529_14200 [Solirubrobacteraceae bacterium]|jgi:hypothetical protein